MLLCNDKKERRLLSTFCWWSQLIDATLYLKGKDGVCSDEAKILSRVQYGREDGVVGSLAAWGVVESDWAGFWQAVIFNLFPVGPVRRHSSRASAPISAGAEPFGARGDIQGHCGGTIDKNDGQIVGPVAIDGEP